MVEKQVEFAPVSLPGEPTQVFSSAFAKISSVKEEFVLSIELFRTLLSAYF